MKRREVRRVLWITFGVLMVGALVAITVWMIRIALDQAGPLARSLAAAGWVITFALSWRAFRRSHSDNSSAPMASTNGSTKWQKRFQGWVAAVVAVATIGLMGLSNSTQMVYLAVLTGFLWPMAFWIVRAYVKHPERRETLWARSPFDASSVRTGSARD
jgi:membrane protease YdiL (CAAX protease family)